MEKKQSPMDNILGGVAALIVGIIIVSLKDKSASYYFGSHDSGVTGVVVHGTALRSSFPCLQDQYTVAAGPEKEPFPKNTHAYFSESFHNFTR